MVSDGKQRTIAKSLNIKTLRTAQGRGSADHHIVGSVSPLLTSISSLWPAQAETGDSGHEPIVRRAHGTVMTVEPISRDDRVPMPLFWDPVNEWRPEWDSRKSGKRQETTTLVAPGQMKPPKSLYDHQVQELIITGWDGGECL